LVRSGKADGRWADFLAVMFILALAAVYEVAEWLGAEAFWPGTAESFLGFQGDSLDASTDLARALAGCPRPLRPIRERSRSGRSMHSLAETLGSHWRHTATSPGASRRVWRPFVSHPTSRPGTTRSP
jgi:hypothetical protein